MKRIFVKRSDEAQTTSPFNIKKLLKLFSEINTKPEKSEIVDDRLRKLVEVGFNLYEFMTSHGSIVESASGNKRLLSQILIVLNAFVNSISGSGVKTDSSLLRSQAALGKEPDDDRFARLIGLARNGVRYITSLEKLYKMSQSSTN